MKIPVKNSSEQILKWILVIMDNLVNMLNNWLLERGKDLM